MTPEIQILTAICDTLLPSIARTDDPNGYWARSAGDIGLAGLAWQFVQDYQSSEAQKQFVQLLRLLDHPASVALHGGGLASFHKLPRKRRERVLLKWQTSPLALERQGFQALKRLAGLIYYGISSADAPNPNAEAIGYPAQRPYSPAPNRPAPELVFQTISADTALVCDVVVVGSGAGGGVAAAHLATAGLSVIILDQGSYWAPAQMHGRELDTMNSLYWSGGALGSRDGTFTVLAGSCVGGGTTINWASSFRTPDDVRAEWEILGIEGVSGCDFTADIDAVEARMGVTDRETFYGDHSRDGLLEAGCISLDYQVERMRRNCLGCGKPPVEGNCGWCGFGCAASAKQSTQITYLADAYSHGARIISECSAERVMIKAGKAVGVEAKTRQGHRVTIRAKTVVAAGGAIGSPLLLLRSGIDNSNIGRHLRLHPTSPLGGVYNDPVDGWTGATQGVYSKQFTRIAGPNNMHGVLLETAPTHPGLISLVLPWNGGEAHKADMLKARYLSNIIVLLREQGEGAVKLGKDGSAFIDYKLSDSDASILRTGLKEAARIHAAAGAVELISCHVPSVRVSSAAGISSSEIESYCHRLEKASMAPNRVNLYSAHQMGTCRIGKTPVDSVCNSQGEVFGIKGLWVADASLFPTPSGVNPMISIMALARRTARAILG